MWPGWGAQDTSVRPSRGGWSPLPLGDYGSPPFSPKPCPEPSCAVQAAPTQQPGAAPGGHRGGEERPLHRHRVHGQGETPPPARSAPFPPTQHPPGVLRQPRLGGGSLGGISLGPPRQFGGGTAGSEGGMSSPGPTPRPWWLPSLSVPPGQPGRLPAVARAVGPRCRLPAEVLLVSTAARYRGLAWPCPPP